MPQRQFTDANDRLDKARIELVAVSCAEPGG